MAGSRDADIARDARSDLASDLAYVRGLAEEGAHVPLVGGRFFLVWGGVMTMASLAVYLNVIGVTKFGNAGFMAPWLVALVIGWGVSFAMRRNVGAKPGAATLGNKTAGAVWFAVGVFMSVFFAALFVAHDNYIRDGVPPYFLFSLLFPVGFGLYGVAFMATAVAGRTAWLKYFAYASWGFAVLHLFFLTSALQFLIGAAGVAACAVAPGLLLMRREPAEIV